MKNTIFSLCVIISFLSCKTETKKELPVEELSVAQKIANAHGYEDWNKVTSFEFTFGGKIEEPNSGRSWIWNPKTNDITLKRDNDTIHYNRNSMDSIALKNDRSFINDKFWALIPFQLIWDEGLTISGVTTSNAPVSNTELNKITITYSNEGGYTPGDAYDIFFDKDYIIREWNFRRGNSVEASLSNTFENYGEFNGLKIAQEHRKNKGDWNLLIRNVKVKLKD